MSGVKPNEYIKSLTDEEIREVVDKFMGVPKVIRSTIASDFLMYENNIPQIQVRRIHRNIL